MFHYLQAASTGLSRNHRETAQRASREARRLYERAWLSGWWNWLWASLTGQSRHLLTLAEVTPDPAASNCYSAGWQLVPISQIRGSQGRCLDFDRHFYPRRDHLSSRWLGVATAHLLGAALPPVELIQVGDIYFVRDGHHRISVAKALGQLEINAEVRIWEPRH